MISFDAASQAGGGGVTTQTWAHTVGVGDDTALILVSGFQTGRDINGTPTYNGTPLTAFFDWATGQFFNETYVHYMTAPPTGSNNFSVTANTVSTYIYPAAGSYHGVDQTNPFGETPVYATNTNPSATSLTTSLTTNVDEAWLVGMAGGGNGGAAAGTDTTRRATSYANYDWHAWMDSNGAKTPVGSYSLIHTGTVTERAMTMMQLSPVQSSPSENIIESTVASVAIARRYETVAY